MLLWQGLDAQTQVNFASLYNSIINHNIAKLEGKCTSVTFGALKAIGETFAASSSVGTADMYRVHSTCSNFERSDTPTPNRRGECARQVGAETLVCTLRMQERDWLEWRFDIGGAPLPIDEIFLIKTGLIDQGERASLQLMHLQAAQLRQSMLQTFSSYTTKLMYNNVREFGGPDRGRLKKGRIGTRRLRDCYRQQVCYQPAFLLLCSAFGKPLAHPLRSAEYSFSR